MSFGRFPTALAVRLLGVCCAVLMGVALGFPPPGGAKDPLWNWDDDALPLWRTWREMQGPQACVTLSPSEFAASPQMKPALITGLNWTNYTWWHRESLMSDIGEARVCGASEGTSTAQPGNASLADFFGWEGDAASGSELSEYVVFDQYLWPADAGEPLRRNVWLEEAMHKLAPKLQTKLRIFSAHPQGPERAIGLHEHGASAQGLAVGRKLWALFPPRSESMALLNNLKFGGRGRPAPGVKNFLQTSMPPAWKGLDTPVICAQQAGEVMFTPDAWWHGTKAVGEALGMAFVYKGVHSPSEWERPEL